MKKECCGTCKYRSHDGEDYICDCQFSDGYGEYTMFVDCCNEYEEKQ